MNGNRCGPVGRVIFSLGTTHARNPRTAIH